MNEQNLEYFFQNMVELHQYREKHMLTSTQLRMVYSVALHEQQQVLLLW